MNLTTLYNNIISAYTISRTNRRKATTKRLNKKQIMLDVYLEIQLLQFAGHSYWNTTILLDSMNKRCGYPCKDDYLTLSYVKKIIENVQREYHTVPNSRFRNYTFTLIESKEHSFEAKALQ